MKFKVLSALLIGAGLVTSASAGVIQASFKNYAAEVFGSNTVVLTAPTISYSLAQPLSGTATNPNQFSITWTLSSGTFTAAPPTTAVTLVDPQGLNGLNAQSVTLSADSRSVTANFVINGAPTSTYAVGSQILLGINQTAFPGVTQAVSITNIGTTLGAPAINNGCGNDVAEVRVSVRMTNAAGVEFESNFPGNSNTTPIVQSAVALSVTAQNSATYAGGAGNRESSRVNVLAPILGRQFTSDAGDVTAVSNAALAGSPISTTINIGRVVIADRSAGGLFDLNGQAPYSVAGAAFATNPNTQVGVVEANGLTVNVSAGAAGQGAFLRNANSSFFGSFNADCSTTDVSGAIAVGGATATLTATAANLNATTAAGTPPARAINLCYSVASGNTDVIPIAQFSVTGGSLTKFSNSNEANNPVCPAPIYNLTSNGVRVDVRNYLPQVVRAASGWYSVVRVINTDENQSVRPVAQALLANGTLGGTVDLSTIQSVDGKTGAFAPREVRYFTSTDIDAGIVGVNFGAADVGGNARLRITAPSSSIRVQNYNFNPANGNFFEASAAQGDDGSIDSTGSTVQNTTGVLSNGSNK